MKIPVLVLAFNRADHVSEAMKAIREYQPERLYLECDGARLHKKGEKDAVEAARKAMLDAVDWPCEVKTLFREENLGCANAVNDAITWFFNQEEYGIICEDDIILSQDFFKLCEELLPRYAREEKVMQIVAMNHSRRTDINNSYVYSWREDCWGWASWARAWKKMDMTMSAAPKLTYRFLIKKLGWFEGIMMKYYFTSGYRLIQEKRFNSWATRWMLSILVNDGLVIKPGVNLAINIGMDGGAHYEKSDKDPYADLKITNIDWPLVINDSFTIDRHQAQYDAKDFQQIRIIGLRKKIRRLFKF
jgi:hypothetical protein